MKRILQNKFFAIMSIVVILLWGMVYVKSNEFTAATPNQFYDALEAKEITNATILEKTNMINVVSYKVKGTRYKVTLPSTETFVNRLENSNIDLTGKRPMTTFEYIIAVLLSVCVIAFSVNLYAKYKINKKASEDMANAMMGMGNGGQPGMFMGMMPPKQEKKIAKAEQTNTKLSDVAGCEEEKTEVMEIIDFMKNPKKYTDIGATIPKGILLVGPPGTGKTLMAKAIAGESGVNFFYFSGSEFVEKYVGVGAQRVREMMEEAKKSAPSIIFIDEVDAIGKQRGGDTGGNDERDQTLNQLLVEMDGMDENNGVIVIAATNRPEILDKAFLRKGRFDRKIAISLPNTKGREEILRVHAKKKRISETVDFRDIAKKTNGFSGAELYACLNEAALLAIRANRKEIIMEDVEEGIDRVIMGHSSKSKKYTDHERALVAYHESGHAVIGLMLSNADSVDKVTIIPRGDAGGYTLLSPKEERYFRTKEEILERICGLLGGRAAEELIFSEVTTGAHNDLERATNLARAIVTQYGMSELGLTQWEQGTSSFAGYSAMKKEYSETTALTIDKTVTRILSECYDKTLQILKTNKALLDALALTLKEEETLTSEQINDIKNSVK